MTPTKNQELFNEIVGKYKKREHVSQDDLNKIDNALGRLEELEKKETPMKPKMVDYTTQHFLCPSCNETISVDESETFNKIFNVFCKYCGQRLDWSDEE